MEEYKFNFDILAHHIIRANEPLQINSLFQYYSARMHFDNKKQEQRMDSFLSFNMSIKS